MSHSFNPAWYHIQPWDHKIIGTLANMVIGEVEKKYARAGSTGFCNSSDRTRDRYSVDILSLIIGFECNCMPEENLI